MAKTKQREGSELEYLRGRLKKLESENRQLKRRVKQLDRRAHFYEDLVDEVSDDIIVDEKCPECKTGKTSVKDFKYVQYEVCDSCEYKRKL